MANLFAASRWLLWMALAACQSRAAQEPPPVHESNGPGLRALASEQAPPPAMPTTGSSGVDPRLPVVGDPLGLLSKPSADAHSRPEQRGATPHDPGALMAKTSEQGAAQAPRERDARAVARGQSVESGPRTRSADTRPVSIQEKSAHDVIRRATQGGAKVHVLLLYAAYCKACRGVMPTFVELARLYKSRGVAFTAASVDDDPEAFANYAAVLGGALEPFWIRPDGTTKTELTRAGLQLPGNSFSIPLFAVFAGQNRLVTQGHSRELKTLARTLDGLL